MTDSSCLFAWHRVINRSMFFALKNITWLKTTPKKEISSHLSNMSTRFNEKPQDPNLIIAKYLPVWCGIVLYAHKVRLRLLFQFIWLEEEAVCVCGGGDCASEQTIFQCYHWRCCVLVLYEHRWLFYWVCDTSHGHSALISTLSFTGKQEQHTHTHTHTTHTCKTTHSTGVSTDQHRTVTLSIPAAFHVKSNFCITFWTTTAFSCVFLIYSEKQNELPIMHWHCCFSFLFLINNTYCLRPGVCNFLTLKVVIWSSFLLST